MKTVYDIRQILKRFGIFIYVGERLADLSLIELEITELYKNDFITVKEYQQAILILRKEKTRLHNE